MEEATVLDPEEETEAEINQDPNMESGPQVRAKEDPEPGLEATQVDNDPWRSWS